MTTSLQRVLTALGGAEPDRVPWFPTLTMHGARELGVGLREYLGSARDVVEGQLRMQRRYRSDFLYGLLYAAVEAEAFGSDVLLSDDGPANAGAPTIRRPQDIDCLEPPDLTRCPAINRARQVIEGLAAGSRGEIPVIGVVVAPFSLPIMQMGFEGYLRLLYEDAPRLQRLLAVNERHCVTWANAQLAAGATAICYFDPLASPSMVPRELYLRVGQPLAARVIAAIDGPTATHLASGLTWTVMDDIATTGTQIIGVSSEEDLAAAKAAAGTMTVLGNLNALEMVHWTDDDAEAAIKAAIASGAPGGRFVLSDNHGEIPWQVPERALEAAAAAVERWGRYPLDWLEDERRSNA